MRVKKYSVFFLMLAVMLLTGIFDAHSQVTTLGKEFWFGFMENNGIPPDAPDQGIVVITASEPAEGVLEYV